MFGRLSILGLTAAALAIGAPQQSTAMPVAPLKAQVGEIDDTIAVKNHKGGGGGKKHVNKANKGGQKNVKHVKNVKNVKNVKHVNTRGAHRHGAVRHGHGHVHRTVVVRPYRHWVHRPYYGAVIAGVTIGTVIAVSTPRVVPVLSVSNDQLCWYWADPAEVRGYWDYCNPPAGS